MRIFFTKKRQFIALILATLITVGLYGINKLCFATNTAKQDLISNAQENVFKDLNNYQWALESINYLVSKKIIIGVNDTNFGPSLRITREQLEKYIIASFNSSETPAKSQELVTCKAAIEKIQEQLTKIGKTLTIEQLTAGLPANFKSDSNKEITRAELSVILYNAIDHDGNVNPRTLTKIMGTPQVTKEQARSWAISKGAHQRFIDICDTYWKYGELTGIRPDLLYCQAAHETGFGNYGGRVTPDQNNWAGIKKFGATGDHHDDHEFFATPDDGVRAHFNHIAAYIGKKPRGEPHSRYVSVIKRDFSGKIQYMEELSGRWCPSPEYAGIVLGLVNQLLNYKS